MRYLLVTIVSLLLSGCIGSFVAVKAEKDIAGYLATINAHNQQIQQIKASLDIKAYGVMAGFLHEQADIIVKAPHFLVWSLRSFFGPPSIMVASNGEFLTAFDFSEAGESAYHKEPILASTFIELMGFRLHPASAANIFLLQIPLEHATNLRLSTRGQQLAVDASLPFGWQLRSIFDIEQKRVLETELKNSSLSIIYRAQYQDYALREGIYFPASLVLFAQGKQRSARLRIEFLQTEINGESVLPDVFYLRPH